MEGGPVLSRQCVRQWLIWKCQVSRSRLTSSGKATLKITASYDNHLFASLKHRNRDASELGRDIIGFMYNTLRPEQDLFDIMTKRPVAYHEDVTALINATCTDIVELRLHKALPLLLTRNFFTDCSTRFGDLMPLHTTDLRHCLKADFKTANDASFANVRFEHGKGRKDPRDVSSLFPEDTAKDNVQQRGSWKVLLHTLPPNMILEDTCTHLILWALHKGMCFHTLR